MAVAAPEILKRNAVTVFGKGSKTLLLAHGFGCDQNMWQFITPAFESDYRLITFDYVGSGRSDRSAYSSKRYQSLSGYAQDLAEICEALELRDITYISHSVSGMIGALVATQWPQYFGQMLMIAASPRYMNDSGYVGGFERADIEGLLDMMDQNYQGWANYLAPIVMQNADSPEHTRLLEESFKNTDPVIAREFAAATFFSDNRSLLPQLNKPVLIMQCTDDVTVPKEVGRYLHQHLPNATLEEMTATGHYPQVSHPQETIGLIRRYLARTA